MSKLRRFTNLLKIQPGEERLIGHLVLLVSLLELPFTLIRSTAFGLFLAEYGPQSLPYSYIGIAVLAPVVAFFYIKLGERISFSKTLLINLSFLGTCSFFVWLGLKSSFFHSVAFILPLLYQVVTNLGTLVVWQLAGRIYNFQQAKRLFPLLISGTWLANILGGLLVKPLVGWMGASNLLLPATIMFGLALFTLRTTMRTFHDQEPTAPQFHLTAGTPKQPKGLFHDRYILLIFAYIVFWWIAYFFLDNIFANGAVARFPDVNQLTVFSGQLSAFTGIVALISSTFLTSRIIGRFGLRAGLIIEVIAVTLVIGLVVINGGLGGNVAVAFFLVAFAKLLNVGLGFSFSQAAYGIVFQPLSATIRGSAQAAADGIFQPIAGGLAGLGILALTTGLKFNYLGLSYVYLGFAIALIIVIVMLSRRYVHALTQAITKRRLGESPTAIADPASITLFRSHLQDPHPGIAIYALTKLETLAAQMVISELPNLIKHSAPEVRREAFIRVEKLRLAARANDVRNQLSVEDISSVKEAALRALGATTNGKSSSLLKALNETDTHSLRGALIGLLKYGNASAAEQKLENLLTSSSSEDRILAIQILGEVNCRDFHPYLIAACDSPETSRAAGLALISMGTDALHDIETAFSQLDAPHQRLLTLTKVLGHISGTHSQNILLSRLSTPDEGVRVQILNALGQSGYHTKDIFEIQRAVKTEIEQAAQYCAAQVDLGEADGTTLLIAALEASLKQIRNRVLLLSSFVFNGNSIRHAQEVFLVGRATQVSYAIEIMDTQLPAEWKGWVMPLLEELLPQERSQRLAARFPQEKQTPEERLCAIIEDNRFSFWVRACAVYTNAQLFPAVRKGDPIMLSTVEKVLILKTVSIFSQTPDNVLADVTDLLEEVNADENEMIFKQGDSGDSMYIIIDGKVRVHTDERLLNYLGDSEVFGEMALLDPEPRLASITAVEPTRLFRLDQSPFYQLMAERPEVATGIIRVLTKRLRGLVHDISQPDNRIIESEQAVSGNE